MGMRFGGAMLNGVFSSSCSGVLVPGGFGVRGTEGKIQAISWARKQKKPFLGEKHVKSIRRKKAKERRLNKSLNGLQQELPWFSLVPGMSSFAGSWLRKAGICAQLSWECSLIPG